MTQAQSSPAFPAFGEFVKTQRALAQLSLRQASQIARISNPYLSQIEHGWVLPSVTVMNKLAEAFSLSAETMMMHAAAAAGGDLPTTSSTEEAIQQDPRLSVDEKKALLLILESFTKSPSKSAPPAKKKTPRKTSTTKSTSQGEST